MWIINKHIQKTNGLQTISEARGSDLIRLLWAPDSTVHQCPAELNVDGSRLFKLFGDTCRNKTAGLRGKKNQV